MGKKKNGIVWRRKEKADLHDRPKERSRAWSGRRRERAKRLTASCRNQNGGKKCVFRHRKEKSFTKKEKRRFKLKRLFYETRKKRKADQPKGKKARFGDGGKKNGGMTLRGKRSLLLRAWEKEDITQHEEEGEA